MVATARYSSHTASVIPAPPQHTFTYLAWLQDASEYERGHVVEAAEWIQRLLSLSLRTVHDLHLLHHLDKVEYL